MVSNSWGPENSDGRHLAMRILARLIVRRRLRELGSSSPPRNGMDEGISSVCTAANGLDPAMNKEADPYESLS